MPRRARMYIPSLPYHIVQRGNNREACFIEPENYLYYLELWKTCAKRYGISVHAYCLMSNHIHFLVTPDTETSISKAMSVIGSRYAYYFNRTYKRSGTIWEGRHKSSLVQCERYLLACMRYIELNPVVANMVSKAEEYKWSSFMVNAWGKESALVHHDEYLKLDKEQDTRCYTYRELFKHQLSEHDIHLIEKAEEYCQPVGDERFKKEIERNYGLKLGQMSRGRPKKSWLKFNPSGTFLPHSPLSFYDTKIYESRMGKA